MAYRILLTDSAIDDIAGLRKTDQCLVLDRIQEQLMYQPTQVTRNRKPMDPNTLSDWELRIEHLRVFYDVDQHDEVVKIKAVGWKDHNTLYIRGKETKT